MSATTTAETDAARNLGGRAPSEDAGLLRRSWHAMADLFSPFSSTALAALPRNPQGLRERSTRTDRIPDEHHQDYGTMREDLPPGVRVPKKLATPIKVEGKVWLAAERTWIAYLNIALLLGTLSLMLFNATTDPISRRFAYTYAAISIVVLIYGYLLFQRRITMIRKRHPGNFDETTGPLLISAALFIAVLSNFILRRACDLPLLWVME
ncbi:hypothetical protein FRC17_008252 [Serendipita sp. 399]|nr:hypothetical protein FRC17_008252 [Serendipita sp. 399]